MRYGHMLKLLVGACLAAAPLHAEDTAGLKAEVADLKAKVAALESARMAPAAAGHVESLTSLRRKGAIRIGGHVMTDLIVTDREDVGNGGTLAAMAADDDDQVLATYFNSGLPYGSRLDFRIEASADTFLHLSLNLSDFWDEAANQDDLLQEAYFLWTNVRGTNWDLLFGKKEWVDYGMDHYAGITPSLHDGWAYWLTGLEANVTGGNNPHAAIGTNALPTAAYRAFQVEAIYHYRDIAELYLTIFQNNLTTGNGAMTRGMHEDRPDDSLLFQSFAVKAEFRPLEALTLQASFINYHNESAGDRDLMGPQAEEDMSGLSLGLDYTFRSVPLRAWGEYQHGFDWTHDDRVATDTAGLGATWNVTEAIDLSLLGEWARIDDGTYAAMNNARMEEETYWQVVITGTYTFEHGIYATLEYAHQWYDGEIDGARRNTDVARDADLVGLRMGWEF